MARTPGGTINVVDPSPLNWLLVTFHTMPEPVRADPQGNLVPFLAESFRWVDSLTLEFRMRRDVQFHDGTALTAANIRQNFTEMQRWAAPHPPGTSVNLAPETHCEIIDPHTVRFRFPTPDGLALYKLRGFHIGSPSFWDRLGFGYATKGTGEGRW
ncbi:MAG TPA: ABC transporter substrate-binding protein [Symbiobacteriaceae bacterium]|nr:ABC transporter substrate-binding protein [Symbiobacteriaceae bacterium]